MSFFKLLLSKNYFHVFLTTLPNCAILIGELLSFLFKLLINMWWLIFHFIFCCLLFSFFSFLCFSFLAFLCVLEHFLGLNLGIFIVFLSVFSIILYNFHSGWLLWVLKYTYMSYLNLLVSTIFYFKWHVEALFLFRSLYLPPFYISCLVSDGVIDFVLIIKYDL